MSLINQIKGIFVSSVPNPQYIIYTNQVLDPDPQTSSEASSKAIKFGSLFDISFHESTKIAFEPIENSDFTSDSIQQNPDTVFLTGIYSPYMQNDEYTNQDYRNDIKKTIEQIQKYKKDKTLLTLIEARPIFKAYSSLHIVDFKYDISPDHLHLRAYLQFQEVRLVTTTQYGSFQQKQVANPANTSTVQTGQVSPQTPTTTQASPFQ